MWQVFGINDLLSLALKNASSDEHTHVCICMFRKDHRDCKCDCEHGSHSSTSVKILNTKNCGGNATDSSTATVSSWMLFTEKYSHLFNIHVSFQNDVYHNLAEDALLNIWLPPS